MNKELSFTNVTKDRVCFPGGSMHRSPVSLKCVLTMSFYLSGWVIYLIRLLLPHLTLLSEQMSLSLPCDSFLERYISLFQYWAELCLSGLPGCIELPAQISLAACQSLGEPLVYHSLLCSALLLYPTSLFLYFHNKAE